MFARITAMLPIGAATVLAGCLTIASVAPAEAHFRSWYYDDPIQMSWFWDSPWDPRPYRWGPTDLPPDRVSNYGPYAPYMYESIIRGPVYAPVRVLNVVPRR